MRTVSTTPVSKLQRICADLTQMAKQVGPGARLPSITQLRKSLQVSTSTLDRALAELEKANIIQREHGRGIFVSNQLRPKTIGVLTEINPILPRTSPFYALLIDHACLWIQRHHYGLATYLDLPYDPTMARLRQQLEQDIASSQIDGILVAGARNSETLDWLSRQGVPFVYRGHQGEPGYTVDLHSPDIVHLGTAELKQRGCQHIGLISDHDQRWDAQQNRALTALQSALSDVGLPFSAHRCEISHPSWEERLDPRAPTHEQRGKAAFLRLWERHKHSGDAFPDGLIVPDDMLARGVMVGLHEVGWQPGKDIQIVCATNAESPTLACYMDKLIIANYDTSEIAAKMLEVLDQLMRGKKPPRHTTLHLHHITEGP